MAQSLPDQQDGFSFEWIPAALSASIKALKRVEAQLVKQIEERMASMTPENELRLVRKSTEQSSRRSALNIEWSYQLDPLSAVFMLIVTGVGLCIFVFATGYMHGETGFYRFFAAMGLFMFAMLVLVMGSNFLMMFVGWKAWVSVPTC